MSDGDRVEVLYQADAVPGETRTVSVLVSLLTLGLVDNQLLAPILPEIAASLGTSEVSVGRSVVGYALAAALAALITGPLSDASGRRRFLIAAGGVFGLGSVLVAAAPSFVVFVGARVVTGAAAGIISALVVAAIADVVPYERRGRAMAWVAAAYAVPVLVFPPAGWIAEHAGWRTNYVVFAAVGAIVTLAVALWFDEPERHGRAVRSPRAYIRFLKEGRSTAAGVFSAFFVTGGFTGFLLFLGAYLRTRFGLSVTSVFLVFFICGVAGLVGALSGGWLSDRVGKSRVALAGSAALAFFLIVVPETGGALLYLTLGLVGLSAMARVAPLQSLVTELVSAEERGAYVALRNTLSQVGNATAAALASVLYEYFGFQDGFQYICWMTSAFSIAAVVLLLLMDEPSGES